MEDGKDLELLFRLASDHEFEEFEAQFSRLQASLPTQQLGEAYLMRAQIKLYATDLSLLDDLARAEQTGTLPLMPFLGTGWPADAPNRFIVFPRTPDALRAFMQALPQVQDALARFYGEAGKNAARQIQSDLYYFMGEPAEALRVAEVRYRAKPPNPVDAMLALCLRFRCCLALRQPKKAELYMLDMIRLSKTCPECQATYRALRNWANLTTNWNGDSPRFYVDAKGQKLPVLEDRLADIRMGSARTTPLEEPFIAYAAHHYKGAYALRQVYMDIFHALYWFTAGDYRQAKHYFQGVYDITATSGVVMPLVECGEQGVLLFQHMKASGMDCPHDWLDNICAKAQQYEEGLTAYRASNP